MVRKGAYATYIVLALAAFIIASPNLSAQPNPNYTPTQTLTAGGAFAAHPVFGDAFGQVVTLNGDFLFVSSFASQPENKRVAGAIFVYKFDGTQYRQTQVITTGGTSDHLGAFQILSEKNWLMVSAIGTPAGPLTSDTLADQNFKGAVFIYRLQDETCEWQLVQTLDSGTPGLNDLSAIVNGGANVFGDEQGANFGLKMALDSSHGWLLVCAQYQANTKPLGQTLINSGRVYAFWFNRQTDTWEMKQALTSPDGVAPNDTFGASVAVKGDYAMISNGVVFQGPRLFSNGSVYVYRLGKDEQWSFTQKLKGTQIGLTFTLLPGVPVPLPVGDSFGSALAMSERSAFISAPFESRDASTAKFTGAGYFFQLEQGDEGEVWVRKQRIESDDPRSVAFGLVNADLTESDAIIPDFDRPGPTGVAMGAAHVYHRTGDSWVKAATLTDANGTPSGGFGMGVSLGKGKIAVGSSPFMGFFMPRFVRPPIVAPPLVNGKVIIYKAQ